MSFVITPCNLQFSSGSDRSCGQQSLSRECCPLLRNVFDCCSYRKPTENKNIPELKVLAQNVINSSGIEEKILPESYLQLIRKCSLDIAKNLLRKESSDASIVDHCRSGRSVDEPDKPCKSVPIYIVMQKDMKFEENRLETFKNWPLSYVDPSDLAAVGFFYLQCDDKVQCAFCRGIIVDWAPGDDPLTEHSLHFPLCPFLMNRDVGNVPVSGSPPLMSRFNHSYPENSKASGRASCSNSSRDSCWQPKFTEMSSKTRRLATFANWKSSAVRPEVLAEVGFFYSGKSDITVCFNCGGTLGQWNADDNPLQEHKKHYPHCEFVHSVERNMVTSCNGALQTNSMPSSKKVLRLPNIRELLNSELCVSASKIFSEELVKEALERQLSKKGQMFQKLEDICSTILEIQELKQKNSSPGVESQAEAKNVPNSSDRHMCKICWDREIGIVFLPCGHIVACPECALSVEKCPVCRHTIENTVRAYLS